MKKLSRQELKNVMGGLSEIPIEVPDCNCNSDTDCPKDAPSCKNCGSNGKNGQKFGKCYASGVGLD